jgi:hypothetical protein
VRLPERKARQGFSARPCSWTSVARRFRWHGCAFPDGVTGTSPGRLRLRHRPPDSLFKQPIRLAHASQANAPLPGFFDQAPGAACSFWCRRPTEGARDAGPGPDGPAGLVGLAATRHAEADCACLGSLQSFGQVTPQVRQIPGRPARGVYEACSASSPVVVRSFRAGSHPPRHSTE